MCKISPPTGNKVAILDFIRKSLYNTDNCDSAFKNKIFYCEYKFLCNHALNPKVIPPDGPYEC